MEEKIVYFEKPGVGNTEETLRLAVERAQARGIKKIVLASTRGDTARLAAERLAGTGITMTVIPHQYSGGREQRFPLELKESLEKQGHHVHLPRHYLLRKIFTAPLSPGSWLSFYALFPRG